MGVASARALTAICVELYIDSPRSPLTGTPTTRRFCYVRHPAMCTHLVALLYYISEPPPEACVHSDIFGRPIYPLRYMMWTISVSSMVIAIFVNHTGIRTRSPCRCTTS